MVIDMHVHPVLFGQICTEPGQLEFRKKSFGVYKSSAVPMEQVIAVMDHACVDQAVLLGEDYTADMGMPIVSNQQISEIVSAFPNRFIGFASVDPRTDEATDSLKAAFGYMGLQGLKLNLSHLHMNPDDQRLIPLYQICCDFQKPIMFHSGFSWEPDSPSKYGRPILYEDVAVEYPQLRFCLAHLGWPWIEETVMMVLKYRNVYTDTATVFMDSPVNWFDQIFMKNMAPGWLQNNLADKVMYGSNLPRFRQVRTMAGLRKLPIRQDVLNKILGENAAVFLGRKEQRYDD